MYLSSWCCLQSPLGYVVFFFLLGRMNPIILFADSFTWFTLTLNPSLKFSPAVIIVFSCLIIFIFSTSLLKSSLYSCIFLQSLNNFMIIIFYFIITSLSVRSISGDLPCSFLLIMLLSFFIFLVLCKWTLSNSPELLVISQIPDCPNHLLCS